ncbi:hypothetical protein [Amaricoccus macauensis]|uniref:hypothetical protein n=1 Tax=Amaricoccus macauensis TaxID=57001 RepID=UPI003C79EE87
MTNWLKSALPPFNLPFRKWRALDLAIFGTSILLAAVIAMLWIWLQDLQQARSWLVEQSSQLLLRTIDFEREIGFGGFIHNFKNAVLRPDELFYISAASSNLANALLMLDELDQQILIAGAPIDLYPIRKTLEQYSQSIQTLIDQQGKRLSPTELDALLRVNDLDANDNLTQLVGIAREQVYVRMEDIREKIATGSDWFAMATTLLTALLVFLFRKRKADAAFIQRQADEKTAFLLDHVCEGLVMLSDNREVIFLNSVARDLFGHDAIATPCPWPSGLALHDQLLEPDDSAEGDLVQAILSGKDLKMYPANLTRLTTGQSIPLRVTTVRHSGGKGSLGETMIVLQEDQFSSAKGMFSDGRMKPLKLC